MKKRQNVVTDNGSDRDSNFEPKNVGVGSRVTVRFLNSEPEVFRIVQENPDPEGKEATISEKSPLGSCLLEAVVGDVRKFILPNGDEEFVEVLAIE